LYSRANAAIVSIPMSARLGPKDAEAVLRIVEGDALDKARQRFLGRRCRGWLHARIFVLHRLSCVAAPA
jgi:hypothetical protein